MLPSPLLLSMQIGNNRLERRQSDGRNRYSGDNKRNQKLEKKNQMTALIGKKRQRGGSGVAETQMVTEDEDDEEANSSGSDRQGGVRQNRVSGDRQDGEIDRMVNRKEIVGQLGGSG
jgi:hypothetical protein